MVLFPGCSCCGCVIPHTASTTGVEVTVEGTGTDVYWSYGMQSGNAFCDCNTTSGTYWTSQMAASYAPPSGTYSLSNIGGNTYFYGGSLVSLTIALASSCSDALRFDLSVSVCPIGTASATRPPCRDIFAVGTDAYAYGAVIQQSFTPGAYSCSVSKTTRPGSWSTPTITQCPAPGTPYAEFALSTWTRTKNLAVAANLVTSIGCGPAVFTYLPENGTDNTVYAATLKVTSIKVLFSGGGTLELLP